MSEWKEVKLRDLIEIKYGKDHKKLGNGTIPVYGSGGVMRTGDLSLYDQPSVLIPRKGTLSNIFYVDTPFWTVDTMFWTKINTDRVLPKFLYYSIKDYKWDSLNVGSAVPSLTVPVIEGVSINLPPLDIQEKIAAQLSEIDDKIAVNKKICKNLEAQAQALFKHWFVDFAPFKDGKFVKSKLGLIPEGWRVGIFIDSIDVMPGGTPSTSVPEYWDNATIPFFSPKDVNGVYCFDTEKHITEKGLNNCSSHLYPKDTLFITARGTVGKIVLAAVPMAMNQSNYALVCKEGVGKFYLYLLTQTIVSVLLKKANGAVFLAITTKDFKENIVCPPFEIISIFETKVKPMFDKIHVLMNESRHLAELRDTLLPKLMSGEIKVDEIEKSL